MPAQDVRANPAMNTTAILNEVERLHATAKPYASIKINGERFELRFNGHNYIASCPPNVSIEFNTRSITQAKKWLREYMAN